MEAKKLQLQITGMTCPSCAAHAVQSLSRLPEVASVEIPDWKRGVADVRLQNGKPPNASAFNEALSEHGYTAEILEQNGSSSSLSLRHDTQQSPEQGGFDTDLLVIGTGGGGMGAALEAARLGKRVTIVEKGTIGGCCVNIGCIPSKAMIQPAHLRHDALSGRFPGLSFSEKELDWSRLLEQRKALVESLRREKYENVLAGFDSITLKRAEASFDTDDDGHPVVLLDDGSRIRAQKYVIATGSRPRSLGIAGEGDVPVLDSTQALFLERKPSSLIVIGGGFVAVELGQAFARLGVPIAGMVVRSRLLSKWDKDISRSLQKALEDEGIPVLTEARPIRFFQEGSLKCAEIETADGERQTLRADEILLAAGRVANSDALNLDRVGIETRGGSREIPVSGHMQTSNPAIYAVGDVSDLPSLVYVAARGGKIAAAHAFGEQIAGMDLANIPEVVFSSPECARVGLSLSEAEERGIRARESKLDLENVPRSIVSNQTHGFVKLVSDEDSGVLLGAHIFSPRAGELIQTASLALAMGQRYGFRVSEFRDMLFAYLTEAEGLKLSAQTFDLELSSLSCCAG